MSKKVSTVKSFGSGSTGVSSVPDGDYIEPSRSRLAGCAWCDRELSVRFSKNDHAWLYPRHQKLGISGNCAGGGATVPPGSFRDD